MHIPDGFLAPRVWGTLDALAAATVGWVARQAQKGFQQQQGPLLGVLGAFIFAAQMINFPVGAGTSGHLVGGALLTFTVGPWAASIVMTAILIVQAFVFQDGGVLALGANITNMALAGVLAAYLPTRIIPVKYRSLTYFTGGALSLMVSAMLALGELLISGRHIPPVALATALLFFAVCAGIEGAITVTVVGALEKIDPEFVRRSSPRRRVALAGLLLTGFLLVTVGFLLASTQPDGIWSLAGRIGLSGKATNVLKSPLADYQATFMGQNWLSRAMAGVAGLVAVFASCFLISRFIARRRVTADRSS
jgi:cobalt/nickel transport system permease protein